MERVTLLIMVADNSNISHLIIFLFSFILSYLLHFLYIFFLAFSLIFFRTKQFRAGNMG